MPWELRNVTLADGQPISMVHAGSFHDDPFHQTVFPGVSFEKDYEGALARWQRNFGDETAHYKVVVDVASGEAVSCAKWGLGFTDLAPNILLLSPAAKKWRQRQRNLRTSMISSRQASRTRFKLCVRGFSESSLIFVRCPCPIEQVSTDTLNYIDLKLLGTLPAHRGKDAASLQLE
ncbi:hypothetical protein B0T10DRAFT_95489 [Thelonectria olida]|uniref:Uncharacterized protein n=1 Tax=Thelonectria olida TaxID=1576542 RepID=A0A9P9AQ28_9HYPO|nr:hypothetical protein B0T10DRAFT_95489 [Thelonectria olida]